MKRIQPTEVVEAYRETGLKPVTSTFCDGGGEQCGACALTAVAVNRGVATWKEVYDKERSPYPVAPWLSDLLGIDSQYANEFTAGFDDWVFGSQVHPGFQDGAKAAALTFKRLEPTL